MAVVLDVMAASIAKGSMQSVVGSTSTKTGVHRDSTWSQHS